MKLLLCPECHDIHALRDTERTCACEQSWGQYDEDGLHATIGGKGIVVGIENTGLTRALYAYSMRKSDQYTLACWLFPSPHRNVTYDATR